MANLVKIDKGVPLPTPRGRGWNRARYPWHDMVVGDSFYSERSLATMRVLVHLRNKNHPPKYRAVREGKGTRVWRIK